MEPNNVEDILTLEMEMKENYVDHEGLEQTVEIHNVQFETCGSLLLI